MKSNTFKKIKVLTVAFFVAVIICFGAFPVHSSVNTEKTEIIVKLPAQKTGCGLSLDEIEKKYEVVIDSVYENLGSFSCKAAAEDIKKLKEDFGEENVFISQKFTMPNEPVVTEERGFSLFSAGDEDGCIKMKINAQDNSGIKFAETNGTHIDVMAVSRGGTVEFEAPACDTLTISDFAGNSETVSFDTDDCFVCEFDDDGNLIWIKAAKVPVTDGVPSYELDENVKIFIWDREMHPKY